MASECESCGIEKSPLVSIIEATLETLSMPSTPVLIYGIFVALFVIAAISLGRMIDKSNKESDERIKLLQKHH
ncbi:MAG: hypothetical protein KJ999_21170 [Gammaproteobacteria bacterium]|nr:hypothetical protein [Gammaproteobacteria bacterium]